MDSRTRFSLDIENIKLKSPDVSYVEIMSEYVENNGIDPEIVPRLLSESLLQKIRFESMRLNQIDDIEEHYAMDELLG